MNREVERIAGVAAPRAVAALGVAAAALEAGDVEVAIEEARTAKRLASRSPSIRELLGLALYQAGDFKAALSELRTAARITGSKLQYPVMADCLRAQGRPEKALELLDEMGAEYQRREEEPKRFDRDSKSLPEDVAIEAAIVRAGILRDEGDLAGAVSALRGVLRDPTDVELHHLRLWYLLADLFEIGGKESEARHLFGRIAEHDSNFLDVVERAAIKN